MKRILTLLLLLCNLLTTARAASINKAFYNDNLLTLSGIGATDRVVLQVVKTDNDTFTNNQIVMLRQFKNTDSLGRYTLELPIELEAGRYLLRTNDGFGGLPKEKELVVSDNWFASSIELTDPYGSSLKDGIIGNTLVAKVNVSNLAQTEGSLIFVGAYYDENNKLIDINTKTLTLPAEGSKQFELEYMPRGEVPSYFKAMLFDNQTFEPRISFSALKIRTNDAAVCYYVAENGSATGDGSKINPYATIQQAVDAAAVYHQNNNDKTVIIYLRGGHYGPASLDADDHNLIITSYPRESAYIGADKLLSADDFTSVTDSAALNRIPVESREYIYEYDLAKGDVEWDGTVPVMPYGDSSSLYNHLLINGKKGQLARYPNSEGFIHVSSVIDENTTFTCDDSHVARWTQAPAAVLMGAWKYSWAMESQRLRSVDSETGTITLADEINLGISTQGQGGRFYIMNLLEELDQDGEWVVENGKLYVYSKNGVEDVRLTDGDEQFTLTNSKNVRLLDLNFQNFRQTAIEIIDCSYVEVDSCVIRNIADNAVYIQGWYNCGVRNSEIYDVDRTGVAISAGDRDNLTNCNHYVVNCKIHDYSPDVMAVWGGIQLYYCGSYVANNEIYDSPNMAIYIHGNQHMIEYNKISNVCYTQTDTGAIYAGRDWLGNGNVIRYNHIDNVVGIGLGDYTAGVYLDDAFSHASIYGNIFTNVDCAFHLGGGRGNTFRNNIIYGAAEHSITSMQLVSREDYDPAFVPLYENLNLVDYKRKIWQDTYPEVQSLLEDEPKKPKYNVIENNVIYKHRPYNRHYLQNERRYKLFNEVNTPKNNIVFDQNIGFVNEIGGNYALRSDSVVYEEITEFEKIPFEKIGTY